MSEVEEVEAEIRKSASKRGPTRGPIVREVNPSSSGGTGEGDDENNDSPVMLNGFLDVDFEDGGNWSSEESDGERDDDCAEKEIPLPRGYDTEFWEPLLDGELGGSNAVEVMCSTNDAFDHVVLLNSSGV